MNFAQFFPNDDQFIIRFYFFTLTRPKQTCADPDAFLKNFTFLKFEFFVLKILTDFLNFDRFVNFDNNDKKYVMY